MKYPFAAVSKMYLLAVFGLSLFGCLPVFALDTQVGAQVCGSDSPGASISITQPNDDSIVDQSPVTVRGGVGNASQIEINVDDQYVGTLAMGTSQTIFETDVALEEGTHTIQLVASDICQGQDATDEVVVTYQPATDPSDGGSTPTDVNGGVGVDPTNDMSDPDSLPIAERLRKLPLVGPVLDSIVDFAVISGVIQTVSNQNLIVATSRIVLTVSALSCIVLANTLTPVAVQFVPSVSRLFNPANPRSRSYFGWTLRGIGILIFAIAYGL